VGIGEIVIEILKGLPGLGAFIFMIWFLFRAVTGKFNLLP